jgi:hypothetical protein
MTTEQINDWRYPPVPQSIQEVLKNHPELIAHLEWALRDDDWRMSNSLSLSHRVERIHSITEYLKDGLSNMSVKARAKLEAAQASGDEVAIAAAIAEREAITQAIIFNNSSRGWDEFMDFYGLESLGLGRGMRIKEGK